MTEPLKSPIWTRRQFVSAGMALSSRSLLALAPFNDREMATFPAWSPGEFDIHQIDTGRGNAAFLLAPDGTTLLIDCGTSSGPLESSAPPRPDASRLPGEWVARYAMRHARAAGRRNLDYMIATHVHPDHVGDLPPDATLPADGSFIPTGLSQVDQLMPADTVIDRGFPDYGELPPLQDKFSANYLAWLSDRRRAGKRVERLDVGSTKQIVLRYRHKGPSFSVRGLAANGRVWTRAGNEARSVFPDLSSVPAEERPSENAFSIALRVDFGRFSYFTGGDLNADTHDGRQSWLDVETPVVEACGRVEVAVADHHAYFDACGPQFVRSLDAQAYVIPSWHLTHPGQAQLERLVGAWPRAKHHDVFATEMLPANQLLNSRWVKSMRSTQGHIVVRVASDSLTYKIFVLDSTTELDSVKSISGPYTCRA
ncbi:MAG TPA: MBL fold metallo-hydrolase [Acidobacteriaceae bacterium]|jgi:beta-lactamase superfamily II metal-dependent hydrolase